MDEYSIKSNNAMEFCYVFIYTLQIIISSLLLINSQAKARVLLLCIIYPTKCNLALD
jgi:hypothetical protein